MSTNFLRQNRPLLFTPSVIRSVIEGNTETGPFIQRDFESLSSSSLGNTGSFRYDLPNQGIKSTQQLNISWSNFEDHTFFNSAHVKTNVAFRKIFNQFPFDGTQSEFEKFIDSLTGFEKWVYDSFPKNKGYLYFSGTRPGESGGLVSGTFVTVKDAAGVLYPGVSKTTTGNSILNPISNSLTLEFWLYLPSESNSGSFICHKVSEPTTGNYHGFSILSHPTSSLTSGSVGMSVHSGTYVLSTSVEIPKGQWSHLAYVWNRNVGNNRIYSYLNGNLYNSSSQVEIGALNMNSSQLLIGSGTNITSYFTSSVTLSGALDELRIWHEVRNSTKIKEFLKKNVFGQANLKFYAKFNEASGSGTPIVLDHSGNSIHGYISNWATTRSIREIATGSIAGASPMTYEKLENNPILFPMHPDVESLNETLLEDAIEFDNVNPNRIDRLIPKHYLLQGQTQDGLETEEGTIVDALVASGATPDTAKLGETQVILLLLYTWAKFFDELKLFIQAFGDLGHIDYNSNDTVPDAFLQLFASKFGIELPPLFTGSDVSQFINGENVDSEVSTNDYSLQYIQNQIWRRILLNIKDVLDSKGTIHSIKSFIRSVGIEPDNNFRIREFGGPSVKSLKNSRDTRSEVSTMISFLSGALITSPYLSASRTEPGKPAPSSSLYGANDGLLTSGSWTYEGWYRFPQLTSSLNSATQSLVRMQVTGSSFSDPGLIISNLVALPSQGLVLYFKPGSSAIADTILSMSVDIFDGDPWYISFGVRRGDEFGSSVSSSVFLRAAKQNFGEITNVASSSGYTVPYASGVYPGNINYLSQIGTTQNPSGAFLQIGYNSGLGASNSGFVTGATASYQTRFDGRVGQIKFWSKYLDESEWREHVRNFKSLGVQDPTTNFNFVTNKSGSWERLRMDISSDQTNLSSSVGGSLILNDFSQNNLHWSGTFTLTSSQVIVPQKFHYSLISPKFDVGATTDKVRVRSFQNYENVLSSSYAQVAPLYKIEPSERPEDNARFTIDYSIVDALDQDIINIFGTLDILDNAIGNPELAFSPDYPTLEVLKDVYFNRLTDRINIKSFFEFYKWFDRNIGVFIAQLIPRKTKFLGTNFVIESHMLDRAKVEYLSSDIYLGDTLRNALKDTIFFQQFVTTVGRF